MNRYSSAAGAYRLPVAPAAAEIGLDASALAEALRDFARRGLILLDEETGEVFIRRWWSYHKCKTAPQRKMVERALEGLESPEVRVAAREAYNHALARQCPEKATKKAKKTPAKTTIRRKKSMTYILT